MIFSLCVMGFLAKFFSLTENNSLTECTELTETPLLRRLAMRNLYRPQISQMFIAVRWFLDVLEELGCCAALDFVIWSF